MYSWFGKIVWSAASGSGLRVGKVDMLPRAEYYYCIG
jgi:hypothetical protein